MVHLKSRIVMNAKKFYNITDDKKRSFDGLKI